MYRWSTIEMLMCKQIKLSLAYHYAINHVYAYKLSHYVYMWQNKVKPGEHCVYIYKLCLFWGTVMIILSSWIDMSSFLLYKWFLLGQHSAAIPTQPVIYESSVIGCADIAPVTAEPDVCCCHCVISDCSFNIWITQHCVLEMLVCLDCS